MQKRVALITGASGGIGSAIARELAQQGISLALHYHRKAQQASELALKYPDAACFQADLCQSEAPAALVTEVLEHFGRLDFLIHCAGWIEVIPEKNLDQLSQEAMERIFALKFYAPLNLVRAAQSALAAEQQGAVVMITSISGILARGNHLAYSAANAALSNLSRSLARALGPAIRVNCVAPGYVETGFSWPADGVYKAHVSQNTHTGRTVEAEEVAAIVRFLCLEAPSVTGQEWAVDGGISQLGLRPRAPQNSQQKS